MIKIYSWQSVFLIFLFPLFTAVAGAQPDGQGRFHYPHSDRSEAQSHSTKLNGMKIIDQFMDVYQASKAPRLMLLINENYSNAIADKLVVASKSDASYRVEGNMPSRPDSSAPLVQVSVGTERAKTETVETESMGTIQKVDGEALGTTRRYSHRKSEFERYKLTPQQRAEIEELFADPWFEAGAIFVDKDLVLSSNLDGLVPELLTHKVGQEKSARITALADKTDLVIELLVTWQEDTLTQVYGEEAIWVPRVTVRVIELATGAILANSSTKRMLGSKRTDYGSLIGGTAEEIDQKIIDQVSLEAMRRLTRSLKARS